MKSRIVEVNKSEYPKLMISNIGNVVLFTDKGTGTLVFKGKDETHDLGRWQDNWYAEGFREFLGELILSND